MKTFLVCGAVLFFAAGAVAEEKDQSMDQSDKWGEELLYKIEDGLICRSVAVHPREAMVAVSTQPSPSRPTEGEKVLLLTPGGKRELTLTLPERTWAPWVDNLAFSPDGARLYGFQPLLHCILVWEVASGKRLNDVAEKSWGPQFALNLKAEQKIFLAVQWPIVNGTAQGAIQFRDANNKPVGQAVLEEQSPTGIEFSSDGSFIVVVGKERLCLIDCNKVNQQAKPKHFKLSDNGYDLSIAPDNRTIAVATADGLFIFDRSQPPNAKPIALKGHGPYHATGKPRVECVKFLRDGTLVSAGGDDTIRLWDVKEKKCLAVLRDAGVQDLAVSTDGYAIFSAGIDGCVRRFYRKGMAPDTFFVTTMEGEEAKVQK